MGTEPKNTTVEPLHAADTTRSQPDSDEVKSVTQNEDNYMRREAKRQNVLQEILSTEKTYVKSLYVLSSHFIRPIIRKDILTREMHEKIFGEIEMIIKINETFLTELERIMNQDTEAREKHSKHVYSPSISKFTGGFSIDDSKSGFYADPLATQAGQVALLLLFYAQSFKLYIGYITNFKNAAEEYRAEKKRNKNFKDLCALKHKTLQKEGQRVTDLEGFLICPVQRIPRYRLLMDELLENMKPVDEGYEDIKNATEMISAIAMYCNERSSAVDKSVRIIEIVEKLKIDKMNFIKPPRRFICEEVDSVKLCKGKELVDCEFYLFSDVILLVTCEPNIFGKKKSRIQQFSLRKGYATKDKVIDNIEVSIIKAIDHPPSASGILLRTNSFSQQSSFSQTFVDVGINLEWFLSKSSKQENQTKKSSDKGAAGNWTKLTIVCDSKEQAIRLCDSINSCVR